MNKAVAQITELFRSMSPGARITAGLLLTAVVVSVAYLFNSGFSGPDTYLLGGKSFSDTEMTRIQGAFGQAQLNNWEAEGTRIRIPRGQQDVYLAALAKGDALPQEFGNELDEMLRNDSMLTSDKRWAEQRSIVQMRHLAKVIGAMDSVDRATVNIHEDRARGLGRSANRSAAIMVFPAGQEVSTALAISIRNYVAPACGIELKNISVINGRTNQTIAMLGSDAIGGSNKYSIAKRESEEEYRDKVMDLLALIPGVVVTTEVTLSKEVESETKELKLDKQNMVPLHTSERSSDSASESGGPGGQPGIEANSPVPNGTQSVGQGVAKQTSTTDSTSNTDTDNAIPHTVTTTQNSGLQPELVKVAVSIPETYFADIWTQRNPPPAGQTPTPPTAAKLAQIQTDEIAKIQALIQGILPTPPVGTTVDQLVKINTFPALPTQAPPATDFVGLGLDWIVQSWSTVAMLMLAAFGLMTLRGLTKSVPVAEPTGTAAVAGAPALAIAPETTEDGAPAEAGGKPAGPRLKRRVTGGPSLREELSEIVKEDPDAAANVLRAWIGSAS